MFVFPGNDAKENTFEYTISKFHIHVHYMEKGTWTRSLTSIEGLYHNASAYLDILYASNFKDTAWRIPFSIPV